MARRENPEINGGSMADIAFIMLIFFIVSTTIASEKGIKVKLPQWVEKPPPVDVPAWEVLNIAIRADGTLFVDELRDMQQEEITDECIKHLTNEGRLPDYSSTYDKAVINIQTHPDAEYQYYLETYSNVRKAFIELRNQYALKEYNKLFVDLPNDPEIHDEPSDIVRKKYKYKIAESVLKEE